MRYAIIGTGAIGGYYGAKLAEAGHEVHFLFHSEYDAVVKNGLQVNSVNGDIHLSNVNAYNDVTKMPKCDAVIVAMKTTSERLLTEMLPHVCADGAVVSLFQNGLGCVRGNVAAVEPDLQGDRLQRLLRRSGQGQTGQTADHGQSQEHCE